MELEIKGLYHVLPLPTFFSMSSDSPAQESLSHKPHNSKGQEKTCCSQPAVSKALLHNENLLTKYWVTNGSCW